MNKLSYHRVFNTILGLLTALFCFAPKLTPIVIISFIPLIVFGYVKKKLVFKSYATHKWLIVLYLLYVIGIIFTQHPDIARGYAENKLSLILFPLLFSIKPNFELRLFPPLIGLVVGIVIASIIGVVNSFNCLGAGGSYLACFTSVGISPIHHPSYFSVFILTAVFGNWWAFRKGEKEFDLKWMIPFTVFAAVFFILCMSLAGMLFVFLLISALLLRWIYSRINKVIFYSVLALVPVLLVVILSNAPIIKDDYLYTKNSVGNYLKDPVKFIIDKKGYKTGNEVRLIMWTVTVKEILEHPFGVGTGNIDDHLSERLLAYGQDELGHMDEKMSIQYNPHNQFLQTTLEIGILGGLVLILFVGSAIFIARKYRNSLLLMLVSCLLFNCLFESMLQRQSGIIFFSFWICFLVVYAHQQVSNYKIEK